MSDMNDTSRDKGKRFDFELIHVIRWGKRIVAALLLIAMTALVLYATAQLFFLLLGALLGFSMPAEGFFAQDRLLEAFGVFLTVLIALELIETVEAYLTEGYVRADKVVLIAVIAVGRKIVLHDPYAEDPLALLGIAALTIALGAAFYLLRRGGTYEPKD